MIDIKNLKWEIGMMDSSDANLFRPAVAELERLYPIEKALTRLVRAIDEITPEEAREFWSIYLLTSLKHARKALSGEADD